MTTQLMTYDDLASALGIAPDSARKLARRRNWRRQPGNDGKIRIEVPIERLPPSVDSPRDNPPDSPQDSPGDTQTSAQLMVLEAQIASLRELVASERARADAAAADRDRWHELATQPWWRRLVG